MIKPERRRVEIDPDLDQRQREEALFLAVYYACDSAVPGHIAEFGSMTGNSADALAQGLAYCDAMNRLERKELYLFDSFEGMPASEARPDLDAPQIRAGMWAPGTARDLDPDELRDRIADVLPNDRIVIVPGWFKNTVPAITVPFSCIFIDCDLFSSTVDALAPLFAKRLISRGAIILFDDWNFNQADRRYGEQAAWHQLVHSFDIDASNEGSYGAHGRKFIVHAYLGMC